MMMMKYLALTNKGTMQSLGDCKDWEAANEAAEDAGLDYFYLTSVTDWVKIAYTILYEMR